MNLIHFYFICAASVTIKIVLYMVYRNPEADTQASKKGEDKFTVKRKKP